MADFNGTRDSNVAISEDNAGRKVLILDTITQFDSGVGNIESAEGVFDLGGTDSLLLIQQTLIQIYNHQDFTHLLIP